MNKFKYYLDRKNWIISDDVMVEMGEWFCDLKSVGDSGYEYIMRCIDSNEKGGISNELKGIVKKYGMRVFEEFFIRCMLLEWDGNFEDVIVCF